jgi:hypothetical protein
VGPRSLRASTWRPSAQGRRSRSLAVTWQQASSEWTGHQRCAARKRFFGVAERRVNRARDTATQKAKAIQLAGEPKPNAGQPKPARAPASLTLDHGPTPRGRSRSRTTAIARVCGSGFRPRSKDKRTARVQDEGTASDCGSGFRPRSKDNGIARDCGSGFRPRSKDKGIARDCGSGFRPRSKDKGTARDCGSGFRPRSKDKGTAHDCGSGFRPRSKDKGTALRPRILASAGIQRPFRFGWQHLIGQKTTPSGASHWLRATFRSLLRPGSDIGVQTTPTNGSPLAGIHGDWPVCFGIRSRPSGCDIATLGWRSAKATHPRVHG